MLTNKGFANKSQAMILAGSTNPKYRKISFNEMQLRKDKNLCFNYDEKFTPPRRCANRRLLLL